MDGAVSVGVHVRIDSSAAQRNEDGRKRIGGEVHCRSSARTWRPVRIFCCPSIGEIRFAQVAGQRGSGDHPVKKQF